MRGMVIGLGRFGLRASKRLSKRSPGSLVVSIDNSIGRVLEVRDRVPGDIVVGDSVDLLASMVKRGLMGYWIIPAVPFHLLFEVLLRILEDDGMRVKRLEIEAKKDLPNFFKGMRGDGYVSFADFICPEDCIEPKGRCAITGEERPIPLYELIRMPFERRGIPIRVVGAFSLPLAWEDIG